MKNEDWVKAIAGWVATVPSEAETEEARGTGTLPLAPPSSSDALVVVVPLLRTLRRTSKAPKRSQTRKVYCYKLRIDHPSGRYVMYANSTSSTWALGERKYLLVPMPFECVF